jgi:hypothetical protein
MRLINVKTYKLKEFLDHESPKYAILSHTWGNDGDELSFRDVEQGRIAEPGIGSAKFLGSCRKAAQDGLEYVWIDTCCIDKTNLVELSEAINSMFRWYQRASVCYAYLSDVPSKDNPRKHDSKFCTSRWFKRGWTLQELLAPKQLRFYNSEWECLGSKADLWSAVERITSIPYLVLLGFTELHSASVAQRMSWAVRRETKRPEDIAYCLLGLFGVSMSMIYGEGSDQAFFRLQEQIMRTTRDDSILAWGLGIPKEEAPANSPGQAGDVTAGRILATTPTDFAHSGHIICRQPSSMSPNLLDMSGGSLRLHLPLLTTPSGGVVGLLNCGPKSDPHQVVGIPLVQTAEGPSDEYVRPEGWHAALQPISTLPRLIRIRNDHPSKKPTDETGERLLRWLYNDDTFADIELDLVDVFPSSYWDREHAVIKSTLSHSDGTIHHKTLARFRHSEDGWPDFVMLLELKQQGTLVQPKCHVMICSEDMPFRDLADELQHILERVSGRDSASNGLVHLRVTLESDMPLLVFTIKLEALSSPPDDTIDIAEELQEVCLNTIGTRKRDKAEQFPCPMRKRNPLRFNCRDWEYCSKAPFKRISELKQASKFPINPLLLLTAGSQKTHYQIPLPERTQLQMLQVSYFLSTTRGPQRPPQAGLRSDVSA